MELENNLKGNRHCKYEHFLELIFFKKLAVSEMHKQLKMELRGPIMPLKQQSTRQLREEARACTCGSQLGMFLTHVARGLSQKYSRVQHSGLRGPGAEEGKPGRAESELPSGYVFLCEKNAPGDTFSRTLVCVVSLPHSALYQAILGGSGVCQTEVCG